MTRRNLFLILATSAAALAGQAFAAGPYTYTSIPYTGYSVTSVSDINNSGLAVVNYGNPSSVGAFIYSYPGGTETQITPPIFSGGGNTATVSAGGINSDGVVVGSDIQTENGVGLVYEAYGFIDAGGTFSFVHPTGAVVTQLAGINTSGEVWGLYNTASGGGDQTYFTDTSGSITIISNTGYSNVTIAGIDDAGEVVGNADIGGITRGYVDSGGVFSTLSFDGASLDIQAISPSGLIAGHYFSGGKLLGFVDDAGTITSFDPFGANITEVSAINNAGTVLGTASGAFFVDSNGVFTQLSPPSTGADPNNDSGPGSINAGGLIGGDFYSGEFDSFNYTAFVAAPAAASGVPEPTAWALMLAGFLGLGGRLRQRRRATLAIRAR